MKATTLIIFIGLNLLEGEKYYYLEMEGIEKFTVTISRDDAKLILKNCKVKYYNSYRSNVSIQRTYDIIEL